MVVHEQETDGVVRRIGQKHELSLQEVRECKVPCTGFSKRGVTGLLNATDNIMQGMPVSMLTGVRPNPLEVSMRNGKSGISAGRYFWMFLSGIQLPPNGSNPNGV